LFRVLSRTKVVLKHARSVHTNSTDQHRSPRIDVNGVMFRILLGAGIGAGAAFSYLLNKNNHRSSLENLLMNGGFGASIVPCSDVGPSSEAVSRAAIAADLEHPKPGSGEPKLFHRYTIADAIDLAQPAVVQVVATQRGSFGLFSVPVDVKASGSGFIIDKEGTIVTNAHVVADGYQVSVTLWNGKSIPAIVRSVDTLTDLAVLKAESKEPLPVIQIGSAKFLRPGEWVIALGSPLSLNNSVTAGIVSNVQRGAYEIGLMASRMTYIQTDAAIQMGNSGGPLIDLDGKVVGINTMKVDGISGIGFAIPIDTAQEVVSQLLKYGKVRRPYLGIKMLGLSPEITAFIRRKERSFPDITSGVLVPQILTGSPADKAGLHEGDIIVAVDDKPVTDPGQVKDLLGDDIGKTVKIEVRRGPRAEKRTFNVTTAEMHGSSYSD